MDGEHISRFPCVAVTVIAVLCCVAIVPAAAFPTFTVRGTYYEAGSQLGTQAAALIRLRLTRPGINGSIRPFLGTPAGQTLKGNLLKAASERFPHLLDELKGIADGSGLPFDDIFMLNAVDEIVTYISTYVNISSSDQNAVDVPQTEERRLVGRGAHTPFEWYGKMEHCTDVVTNSGTPAWGHNEDGDGNDRATNYFVNATILAVDGSVVERFFSFTYAATLAGDAYGWNANGILLSQNAVFASQLNYYGCPGQIAARATYGATSINDAVRILRYSNSANSFNLNIASTVTQEITTVEVDPMGVLGVHDVRQLEATPAPSHFPGIVRSPYWFYHTNMYVTLRTPCVNDPSSDHRMETLAKYLVPNSSLDVGTMLGDTSDPLYPIYRDGNAPDTNVVTLTTVIYDLLTKQAAVFASNPRLKKPLFTATLW
jgi:hypothetical protein